MDKKKSILNVGISIVSRVVLLFVAIVVRRLLIQYIGNDVNGLNSLFTDIIGMLAVAELGVGRAIVYSMYSPIVNGDKKKLAGLFNLYKKLYQIIGAVIFIAGLLVMPFLPVFINDYETINVNVYITFLLTLINVVLSYLYSAKTSLIEAHKDNYITTGILTISGLIRDGLQIAVILIWKSFPIYLICGIMGTLFAWGLTEVVVHRRYLGIIKSREVVDKETKSEIVQNAKAMVMHKIGTILVNSVDSLIISSFVGVTVLGKYSNYNYIAVSMVGIITLFFTPLTSTVGHLCAQGDTKRTKEYFDLFYYLNYVLGVIFFLGYYAVIDNVVTLLFGPGLDVPHSIAFIITLNRFIQYMRNAALLFRNASGTFYNDRWKPIAEGAANLVLSLVFVNVFPEGLEIVGVIIATIITNLLICDTVEPYVIFTNVFGIPPKKFILKNIMFIGLFVMALLGMFFLIKDTSNAAMGVIINGCISIGVSIGLICLTAFIDRPFRSTIVAVGRNVIRSFAKK